MRNIWTLLADRHHKNARSLAPAWERTASEAPPRASPIQNPAYTAIRQAEPAIQWVPRQSLGTKRWRSARSFNICIAILASVLFVPFVAAVEPYGPAKADLTMVVMDPMAGPLACDCVQGYAQRKYERLADYLHAELGKSVRLVWSESLSTALQGQAAGKADIIIGKDSVVRHDAAQAKLTLEPLAQLSDIHGSVMQRGLFVVLASSKVASLLDLEGHSILFGPDDCDEKASAPKAALASIEVTYKVGETCSSCSVAAKMLKELGSDHDAAAVISSYAAPLLEGCGTIKKGDLRVVGETDEVAFISAFAASTVDATMRAAITRALVAMKSPEMLTALETKDGFLPYQSNPSILASKKKPN